MTAVRLFPVLAAVLLTSACTDPNAGGGGGPGGSGDPVRVACEGYVDAAFTCYEDAGAPDLSAAYENPDNLCAPQGQTAPYTAGIYACLEVAYSSADCGTEAGREALSDELEACTGAQS